MSGLSPASVLYSSDGYELAAINGNSIPTGNRGLLVEGSDGTDSRFITVDTSGRVVLVGAGTAGTGVGGVLTIQGNASGTPVPVSGTVTANNASVSTTATAAPGSATYVGGLVTTATESGLTSGDLYALSLTTTGLLRIDGSNVTQPVSGIVTANAGTGSFTVAQATAANLNATVVGTTAAGSGASSGLVTIQGNASGTPVPVSGTVTATNASVSTTATTAPGSATYVGGLVTTAVESGLTSGDLYALSLTTAGLLRVDGSNVTQPVSGTVTANAGTGNFNNASVSATAAAAPASITYVGGLVTTAAESGLTNNDIYSLSLTTGGLLRVDGVYPTGAAPGADANLSAGSVTTAAPTYTTGQMSALSLDTSGNLRVLAVQSTAANLNATVIGAGTAGTANSGVVTIQGISGMTPVSVTQNKANTSAVTTVAGATSTTSILASNANRQFAAIYNNTNKNMYVLLGTGTASSSNFTTLLMQDVYWELPVDYTGAVQAAWANGVTGNALVTELTP
jgi:hypothetical protein